MKLFINKVDIIDYMKNLYIGYYPITEIEIKELMKLIISYKKYDYNSVLKTLKKLNCTSKQQDYVNTILSNCMLNKNTEFFDTQYGIYIAQLQKLYRKHFTLENVSLTQLFTRMHSFNLYTKKWNEIFTFSDVKYLNCLKYPKSSGVFVPYENVKKLYKNYYNNAQTKKFIDDYYGMNTHKFLNALEFCVNNKCGLLEAFDLSPAPATTTTTKKAPIKQSNPSLKNKKNKTTSNPFYSASIPSIPEFDEPIVKTHSSNLIYDVSDFDDSDIYSSSPKPTNKQTASSIFETSPNYDIPYIPEFEDNFSSYNDNFGSKMPNFSNNDIIQTPQFERKTSNLIYDVNLDDYDDDIYTSNNPFANTQVKQKKSSNLIYDVNLDDYEDDDDDIFTNEVDDISYDIANKVEEPKFINNYTNKKPIHNFESKRPTNNFEDKKPVDNFINNFNDNYNEENFEERLQKLNEKKSEKKSNKKNKKNTQNNVIEEFEGPLPEEEKMSDFKRKNKQNAEERKYKSKASKWFPITLVLLSLYLIFNVAIQCIYEFTEPILFKSFNDLNKVTYVSIGIHFVLNLFMWLIVTVLSIKTKIIRKKDRKKIMFFIIIFMVIQTAALFYYRNTRIEEMTNNKINEITNFNTEYEISKLNQEIDELQSSKYSNNNLTRAKIKELQSNLSEYDYYLNTKKEQSDVIINDYNSYNKTYTYYISAINVLMLPLIYRRLRKRTEKADFI